jgi:hypothetical protein
MKTIPVLEQFWYSENLRSHNSEIISLWMENLKKNIWAHKRKSNMESQNQWTIRQADKT